MANKDTYESKNVSSRYSRSTYLHYPEEMVLGMLKHNLKKMKMLDIGVGGGRTAFHFSKLSKKYVGIDYSSKMVETCRKRFSRTKNNSKNISFIHCDARDMKIFKDKSFDFILVSSNALDYINHEDRIIALKEIRRVCKKGGTLLFSSHSLQTIGRLFSIELSVNPFKLLKSIATSMLLRIVNADIASLKKKEYAAINDGAHRFSLSTYYITPSKQIAQLEKAGFGNIRVYSTEDGKEIIGRDIKTTEQGIYHGLYYLCKG